MLATLLVRYSRRSVKNPWHCCKSFHNDNPAENNNEKRVRKNFYKNEEVKKIRGYVLTRYMEYVKNYEKVIEKKFPTAMHLYQTFKVGMKEFYRDLLVYMKIIRVLNTTTDGLKSLTLNEIEIYHKMPGDMIKVAPVLVLSAIPMTNYIIFPLAYFYPRQMLCSHFWTIQQRAEFQIYYLRQKLLNHRPTFRCMQAELDVLKEHRLYGEWAEILGLVGSGVQPTTEQIIACKELFADGPYQIRQMKGPHVKNLLKMHGLHTVWFRRTRLREHAKLLRAMDRAIMRENGIKSMSQESLKAACFMRGFNPINTKYEDMTDWLTQWLEVSQAVDHDSLSLLLHCPILLGYNQPNNWLLIY